MIDPLALYVVLQLADGITTHYAISQGGREANPVLNWFASRLPGRWTWLVAAKVFGVVAGVGLDQTGHTTALWGLCALYVAIVANNAMAIRKMERKSKQ